MAKQAIKIVKEGNYFCAVTLKEIGGMIEARRKAGDKEGERVLQKLKRTPQSRDDGDLLDDLKKGLIPTIIPGERNG